MATLILKGSSLGERQKHLNKLVLEADESELSLEAVRDLSEQPQLQQLYIARLAQRFYKPEVMCELFKSENSMIVGTALKNTQFFDGNDKKYANPDYLIENIFPNATYRTRCKMLSLFSLYLRDESLAEEFYTKILKHYKLNSAISFLPLCSLSFIKSTILNDAFVLPCKELMKIYQRDKNVIIEYLQSYYSEGFGKSSLSMTKRYVSIDYVLFWPVLAQDFPAVFLDFYKNAGSKISPTFGYRTSLVLCKSNPKRIVDHINEYICFLNHQAIVDFFKGEMFDKIIFNLTKYADKDHFYNNYNATKLLGHMKPEYRIIYWMKLYSERFDGASLLDNVNVSPEEFKHLPVNLRTTWAQKKLRNYSSAKDNFDEGYYLKHLTPDVAMPRLYFLKDNTLQMDVRLEILQNMIACCKINNDKDCLLQLMRHVAKKHRNDQEMLRYGFLNELMTSFKLHQLTIDHWNVIDEMLEIMYFNQDIENNYRQVFIEKILEESIHFRILNKLPYDSVVDKVLFFNVRYINLITNIPKYHSEVLKVFYTKMESVIREDLKSETAERYLYLILLSFQKWNEKNKSDQRLIVNEEWLMDILRRWVAVVDKDKRNSVFGMLEFQVETRNEFVNEVFKFNFNKEKAYNYLKHNNKVLLDNIDLLLRDSLPLYRSQFIGYVRFYQKIRAYCGDTLATALIEKLNKKVQESRGVEQSGSIVILSWLLELKNHEDLMTTFIPVETKIEVFNKSDEYQRTEVIAKNIKYINPPISFEIISKFAKDDYLKFALPSMLSLPFKKRSHAGIAFIQNILNCPVSVKKHGIRLAYFLYPDIMLLEMYKKLWQTESNSSIRQVVFNKLMHSFQNEHDTALQKQYFELVLVCLQSLEEKDQGSFQFLKCIGSIPSQFVDEFCIASWRALKRLSESNINVDSTMIGFTSTLWQFVDLLSEEFCQQMIREFMCVYSTNDSDGISRNLLSFIIHYLVNLKSVEIQEAHIKKTCQAFGKFITENWDLKSESEFPHRQTVTYFIEESINQCINFHPRKNLINFLKALGEMMSSALPAEAAFELHLKLSLSIAYLESKRDFDKNPEDSKQFLEIYGKKMSLLLLEYIKNYGILINTYYRVVAKDFTAGVVLYLCDDRDISILRIVGGVLDNSKSSESLLLAISLLTKLEDKSKTIELPLFEAILKEIIKHGDVVVKMVLNERFSLSCGKLFGFQPK